MWRALCTHVLPFSDFEPLPLCNHVYVPGYGQTQYDK